MVSGRLRLERYTLIKRQNEVKKTTFCYFGTWTVFGACPAALGRAGWVTRVLGVAKRPEMTRVLPRDRFATWGSGVEATVAAPDHMTATSTWI